MDIDTDDDVLRSLADGNTMDYEQWPALLSRLISRLEKIVESEFPKPAFLPSQPASSHPMPSSPPDPAPAPTESKNEASSTHATQGASESTQSTDKENAPPKVPHSNLLPKNEELLKSIISTLNTLFSKYPPHTVQRLAELTLQPRQHYKTLASYLHAVDRVVHVSSGANTFPLPPAIPDPSSANVLSNGNADPFAVSWGNATTSVQSTLGSDESLGGALLTPIPWLTNKSASANGGSQHSGTHSPMEREVRTESTEMIEGPNGPGGVETVTVSVNGISSATLAQTIPTESNTMTTSLRAEGGVTQGELLRQEQRAGVVPAAQLTGNRGDPDGLGEEDEVPLARGPEEIGLEDTGPQPKGSSTDVVGPSVTMHGIDVEAAIGRKIEPVEPVESAEPVKPVEMKDGDGDEKMKDEGETPETGKEEAKEVKGEDEKEVKGEVKEDVDMKESGEKVEEEVKKEGDAV